MVLNVRMSGVWVVVGLLLACNDGSDADVGGSDASMADAGAAETADASVTDDADAGAAAGGACDDFDPLAQHLLWGDLHVHTSMSFDAYYFNALNGPAESYAFARGASAGVVCDTYDVSCGERRLARPLDFAANTDHAEFIGTFQTTCETPGQENLCQFIGNFVRNSVETFLDGQVPIDPLVVQEVLPGGHRPTIWQGMIDISDAAYEPCEFTTLHGYEYSPQIQGSMMHRNVIFAGKPPEDVVDSFTVPSEWDFFDLLESQCGVREDCAYLTIPHNPNSSEGRTYLPYGVDGSTAGRDGGPLTVEDAALRARSDVLLEIMNHKGASECALGGGLDGLGGEESDALCGFELLRPPCTGGGDEPPNCVPPETLLCDTISGDPEVTASPPDCNVPADFARSALAEGLRIEAELGVNPYRVGFVGATDTHNGTPGAVEEATFIGHGGVLDNHPEVLLGEWQCEPGDAECGPPDFAITPAWSFNPGGLTAVWATENTREAVFEALTNRRTYATTGPRMIVRSYASGDGFPADICARLMAGDAPVEAGELVGAPMGSPIPGDGAPSIVAWAAQDSGDNQPGAPLDLVQIVKGWVGPDGQTRAAVFDIAGSGDGPDPRADCTFDVGTRPEQLCGVWTDPAFDPGQRAFYYVRMVEQPTCRWNTWICVDKGVDCGQLDPATGRFDASSDLAGYEGCCAITSEPGGTVRGTNRFDLVRERAWTSPFWYDLPAD